MDRRQLLQGFALSLAAGMVTGSPVLAAGDNWKEDFTRALKQKPWLLGYKGVDQNFKKTNLKIDGKLPENLKGIFYRNGPARHEVGDLRYRHWFDGDGMIHAFNFDGESVTHHGRFVDTIKTEKETEAGRALFQTFGTAGSSLTSGRSADEVNVANISVIKHNGELLALWEGGSAYRLDGETLETLGLKTWTEETAGLPFSAHPRVDQDGTLWNFGYAPIFGALIVYRISPTGQLIDRALVQKPATPMVHDFLITENHLILILPPYHFDNASEGAFVDRFNWSPEKGGRALIIDKNNLAAQHEIELPPFWVFHFANAFEDSSGDICFDAPIYQTPDVMTSSFREIMRGNEVGSDSAQLMKCRLNPLTGNFDMTEIEEAVASEFPRIDQRMQGRRHRFTAVMRGQEGAAYKGINQLMSIDHQQQTTESYTFPATEMAEEHVFVPDPDSIEEGKGWLMGTSLDYKRGKSALNLFDAQRVSDGPVARMEMDYAIPLGLHGNFYSS
jgi:all-trans-8'-apo-beta-carotenal 15,15'-oxygenase